jgi:hypothetical protein
MISTQVVSALRIQQSATACEALAQSFFSTLYLGKDLIEAVSLLRCAACALLLLLLLVAAVQAVTLALRIVCVTLLPKNALAAC